MLQTIGPVVLVFLALGGCMQDETSSPRAVQGAAEANASLGRRVRIEGIARDAKLSAAVVTAEGFVVYCIQIPSWPDAVRNRKVIVSGVLQRTDQFKARVDEKGAISQGTAGGDHVLREVTYESD